MRFAACDTDSKPNLPLQYATVSLGKLSPPNLQSDKLTAGTII